jgi:hypothetical protein
MLIMIHINSIFCNARPWHAQNMPADFSIPVSSISKQVNIMRFPCAFFGIIITLLLYTGTVLTILKYFTYQHTRMHFKFFHKKTCVLASDVRISLALRAKLMRLCLHSFW